MPYFDFKCDKCGRIVELSTQWDTHYVQHKQVKRNKCNGMLTKTPSSPKAFILKGDGFYKPSKP